jgi:hypothetical protein
VSELDDFCTCFRAIGVNAQINGPVPEEDRQGFSWESLGLIEIEQSPIRWIEVRISPPLDFDTSHEGGPFYMIKYFVPDNRQLPKLSLSPERIKTFPIFGRVIDIQWFGDFDNLGIARSLNEDDSIKTALLDNVFDILEVKAHSNRSCWTIGRNVFDYQKFVIPTQTQWVCYERIAARLLETPLNR